MAINLKKNTRIYSDFDMDFTAHPLTGDVPMKYDVDAVRRALRNLILTNKYDRPFHPEIESGVRNYLFEPMTPITMFALQGHIERIITRYEPRAIVHNIVLTPNEQRGEIELEILFSTLNILNPVSTTILLQRSR